MTNLVECHMRNLAKYCREEDHSALNPTEEVDFKTDGKPSKVLCCLQELKYLKENNKLPASAIAEAFLFLCRNGFLITVKAFAARFGTSVEKLAITDLFGSSVERVAIKMALTQACDENHFAIVNWLIDTYGITLEDVRSFDNVALKICAVDVRLDMLKLLVSKFAFDEKELAEAKKVAEGKGSQLVVQWFDSLKL